MATLTPENAKFLDTWQAPRGLILSDYNCAVLIDAIEKRFGGKYTHENLNQVAKTDANLIHEKGFSPAEKLAVWQAWWAKHAPKQLLREQVNAGPLINYVEDMCGGVWSLPNFTTAYEAVKDQLAHTPVKTLEEIQQDFAVREKQRIEREALENRKTFDPGARAKELRDQQTAQKDAKAQEAAQKTIDELIANFTINGLPGRIDHVKTQECRKALAGIKINMGKKYDAVLTLKVLQRAYMGETARDIVNLAAKATEDLIAAFNDKQTEKGAIR